MVCPGCGASLPSGARFCPSCGHRATGHGEERRVVTVVFADVVGFTSLSETRDPEQVKHLVDRCFVALGEEVARFGGRVDKIIGDAMLALFGAPIAHEDDPERAVRAALAMQGVLATELADLGGMVRLRIGVNTGEVLVGAMQAGGDYTAMGDVVNTANRLQTAAEPGEVLVGAATYLGTRRVIGYAERGVVPAKGREAPVQAWRALEPVTVPGSRQRPEGVPLIGRDAELRVLTESATAALDAGRGALLLLQGEAGSGKTRLATELGRVLVRERGATALEGRCIPYGEANAWFPVAELLRPLLGVPSGSDLDEARSHIAAALPGLLGVAVDEVKLRMVAGLLQLYGYGDAVRGDDTDRAHDEVVHAVGQLFAVLVQRGPVIVQLSDLHWADPVLLDLFAGLLRELGRSPFIFLGTTRRSLLDRWSPPVGRFDTVALNVDMLDGTATEALLEHLLRAAGHGDLPASDRRILLERSGGNPMFLSELVAAIDDSPARVAAGTFALAELPDTLRGLVAARLDRLSAPERAVVDDAAVLGRRGQVFHLEEMARRVRGVDDITAALDELVERDVLRVDGTNWEFHNDLTREVAYHTLTKSDRATRHLGVAKWIEAHHRGAWSDVEVDLLAHHYGVAAEALADVGAVDGLGQSLRAQALHWVQEAAARAERLSLLRSVTRLTSQGLALAGAEPSPSRLALLLRRARVFVELRDTAAANETLDAADAVAASLADETARASVLVVRGDLLQKVGDLDGAISTLDAAIEAYDTAGDSEGRAEALRTRALSELMSGRLDAAERSATEALAAFRAAGLPRGEAWALQNLAWIALMSGRVADAERAATASREAFQQLGDVGGASWARGVQGFVRFQAGDFTEAERCHREVRAEAEQRGDRWALGMMCLLGAGLRLWSGRTEEAVEQGTEGLTLFRALGDRYGATRIAWPLGRALVMRGRVDDGIAVLEDACCAVVGGTEEDRVVTSLALASTQLHLGRPELAEAALARLDDVASDWADGHADVQITRALQALQRGDAEVAVASAQAAVAAAEGNGTQSLAAGAALALALACQPTAGADGNEAALDALVAGVLDDERSSYLDRLQVGLAHGLSAARRGDVGATAARLFTATAAVDATGDLLSQAIVRLAEGRALEALGDPDTLDVTADAWARLHALGIDGEGWVRLVDLALGRENAAAGQLDR